MNLSESLIVCVIILGVFVVPQLLIIKLRKKCPQCNSSNTRTTGNTRSSEMARKAIVTSASGIPHQHESEFTCRDCGNQFWRH